MKGLWIAAAATAALVLTPFKSKTDETNGETEYRSLLFKYTIKKTTNEDGTVNKKFDANFAGLPSQSDFSVIKENVNGAVQSGVDFVKKTFTKGEECSCHKGEDHCCCHDSEKTEESTEQEEKKEEGCCCHKEEASEETGEEKAE